MNAGQAKLNVVRAAPNGKGANGIADVVVELRSSDQYREKVSRKEYHEVTNEL